VALNPVERRLALLCDDWIGFRSDREARLLVWQVPENALRLVECFVETQKLDVEYASGDVFLLLKAPYAHGLQYARDLKAALAGQFEASVDDLRRQGLPTDWSFDPTAVADSPQGAAAALCSFGAKYHTAIGHLVAVLMPLTLSNVEAHVDWLARLLDARLPERLRILIVDTLEHARYAPLLARDDPRVRLRRPAVDGLTTAQETFAQESVQGPAGVFRNLMMGVVTLLEKGSAGQVVAKATDALAFARKQQWADQEVVLRVMVGGALLKEGRHAEAVRTYRAARQAAAQTAEAGHPAGLKLVLQALIGEAGAQLAAGADEQAVLCYDEAAGVAQRDGDAFMAIESFRMAAFCKARAGDAEGALERGACAFDAGARLDAPARALSTLPVAAADLLRVLDRERVLEMQRLKVELRARDEAARETAERRGAELAAQGAPGALERVEAELADAREAAAAQAQAGIAALVQGAGEPFRRWAGRADELLGPRWLVDNDIAVPAFVAPGEAPEGSAP
jgi:hypothetical protein